jgi:adenylate cyclase
MIREQVASLGGRVFNTAGDAWLAEFASPINALRCAAEIRNTLAGAESIEAAPLRLRFGLHLADVVVQGDDLIGDGVNVASRIQQEADPDSICVSGVFFDHVRRNSPFAFDDLGERRLKNLSEPIRIYRLREELARHRLQTAPTRTPAAVERRPLSLAVLPWYCQLGAEEAKLPRAQPSREYTSAHEGNTSRIAPGEEGAITSSSVLTGGKTVTAELEVVVDRSVSGEELLRMPS